MVVEDTYSRVLVYLKKHGRTNTFKLRRELGIDRHKLLGIIKELENKGVLEFKSGKARFLKFPKEERKVTRKPIKVKRKAKKRVRRKAIARKKISALEELQTENKKLRERLLKLEANIKRQTSIKNKKLREQAEHIEKLEETIKEKLEETVEETVSELQQKAIPPPKVIKKTIIKEVPVELEVGVGEEEKIEPKPKKVKLPEFDVIKNIQQLERPEFIERKVKIGKPKINFSELNKNIQQLHIPKMLRNP